MTNHTYIYTLQGVDGVVRYVGKTDYPKKRLGLHYYNSGRKNLHLKRWLDKTPGITLEIIEIVDKMGWQFWEKWYINLFKNWGFKLINITNGGDGAEGYKHNEDTRLKMRHNHANFKGENHPQYGKPGNMRGKKHKAETLVKMSSWQLGENNHRFGTKCIHSEETKEKCAAARKLAWANGVYDSVEYRIKLSAALKGKPSKNKKSIKCNETGVVYDSIKEAAIAITGKHTTAGNITSHLKGKLRTVYGYTFSPV